MFQLCTISIQLDVGSARACLHWNLFLDHVNELSSLTPITSQIYPSRVTNAVVQNMDAAIETPPLLLHSVKLSSHWLGS